MALNREKRDKKRKREEELRCNQEIFDNLVLFTNKLYELTKSCSYQDPRKKFNKYQKELYEKILDLARKNSEDIDEKYIEDKIILKKPIYIRSLLETDKKIIATAFIISYKSDINILSNNKNMQKLLDRIKTRLNNFDYASKNIHITDLDNSLMECHA